VLVRRDGVDCCGVRSCCGLRHAQPTVPGYALAEPTTVKRVP
jgi:hypothetical protein